MNRKLIHRESAGRRAEQLGAYTKQSKAQRCNATQRNATQREEEQSRTRRDVTRRTPVAASARSHFNLPFSAPLFSSLLFALRPPKSKD